MDTVIRYGALLKQISRRIIKFNFAEQATEKTPYKVTVGRAFRLSGMKHCNPLKRSQVILFFVRSDGDCGARACGRVGLVLLTG